MIDITKKHRTRKGNRVIGLARKPFNDLGHEVSFPIKGSIVVQEKPLKLEYCIWTDEGEFDPIWHKHQELDLVEDHA